MLWQLTHGAKEETVREASRISKMPLPEFILNKPSLLPGLEFYWKAFWEMSTCRDVGAGEGPIPWTTMNEYAIRHDIKGSEFDRLSSIIRDMDTAYLNHRQKNKPKAGNPISTKENEKTIRQKG